MVFPLSRLAARMRAIGTEHTGNEGKKVMRIVLIGISHWHTPFYSDPVLGMKNAAIVGVSDPDAERVKTHPNLGVCSCRAKAGW